MSRNYIDFLKTVPGAAKQIKIRDELNRNFENLLVVDLRSLPIYRLYRSEELCGGRYEKIYEYCETFFQRLSSLNVKLVFFTQMITDRKQYDKKKLLNKIAAQNDILVDIKQGKTLSDIVNVYNADRINNIASLRFDIAKIAAKYGSIKRCVYKTNMACEMCAYGIENNAFAIITEKQATFFNEEDIKIWSTDHMCMINLTTIQIDTGIARRYLQLKKIYMPILGMLLGNLVVPRSYFSRAFSTGDGQLVESCAKFIRKENGDLGRMVPQMFNGMDLENKLGLMQKGINFYKNREIYSKDHEFLLKNSSSTNYQIIFGHRLAIVCPFFDYENYESYNFKPFSDIIQPIFEKRAGILLNHKRSEGVQLEYMSYRKIDCFIGCITPVYPDDIPVPPLEKLWAEDSELQDIRFNLISWVISEDLDAKDIKRIDQKYLPDALTLRFLVKNNHITSTDGDAVLLSVDAVIQNKISGNLKPPITLNEDAMHLAFIYLGVRDFIAGSMDAVGMKNVEPIRFDGFFFQQLFSDWIKMSPEIKNFILMNYNQHLNNIFSVYK